MGTKSCSQIEADKMVEILKNQLYFAVIRGLSGKNIKNTADALYFSIDDEFEYQNYYYDFGPYNISYLYKYCTKLNKFLEYSQGQKRVVHCTSTNAEKKVNAAYLIGSYCIIYLKIHPAEVTTLLMKAGPYKQFMDASQIPCPYTIKLDFCFNAVAKAAAFNFFSFDDFDATEYEMYEKLQFGDMNWMVPRKFLAFIGPNSSELTNGYPPDYYIKYFLKNDIKTVVRLNNKMYDAAVNAGIFHFDLIYPDGSTPSKDILMKFLQIAETSPAAVAVHCKAGLGRTGSLIGAYIVKHYKMTAKEAIAWMRICRPGSVIGQQQIWLEKLEPWLWRCGTQYRCKHYGEGDKIPRHNFGIYSKIWPVERNKILREARRKYSTSIHQYSSSIPEHLGQTNKKLSTAAMRNKPPYFRFRIKNIKDGNCFEDISDMLTTVYGLGKDPTRQQNRTMPNIRVLAAAESKRHTASPKRIRGSQIQRQAVAAAITNTPVPSCLLKKPPDTDSQGDNQYNECNGENLATRKDNLGPIIVQIPMRTTNLFKVDTDTDTSNHVHSYMEERARRKALLNGVRVTQGDKLLERKVFKSGSIVRSRKPSNGVDTIESDLGSLTKIEGISYAYSNRQ